MAKTYHELYVLDGTAYKLLGSVSNNDLGFNSSVRLNYFMINVSKGWTYLDNMKWTELGTDAVSYTHLDVYKRQEIYFIIHPISASTASKCRLTNILMWSK